jgi:localization factor PodJL
VAGAATPDLAALRELAASSADTERRSTDRRADFIAAARRAAYAAVAEAGAAEDAMPEPKQEGAFARIGQAIRNRRKPLLLAAAAIVIAIGAIHLFGGRSGDGANLARLILPTPPAVAAGDEAAGARAAPAKPALAAANPIPALDQAALVAPPADARTAMALAAESVGGRFGDAFAAAASAVPSKAAGASAADAGPASPTLLATAAEAPDAAATSTPPPIGSDKLRAAAAASDPAALFEVGTRFAEGRGVAQSLASAAEWYERAAKAGLAVAQYRLGSLYERGQGVGKDLGKAVEWYQRAADQGNVGAMHNLAVLMSEGVDGAPDHEKALEWFLAAGSYGLKDSQYNLGVIYARGLGPGQDLVESYKWFAVAAAQGDTDAAGRRDEVAALLDADQLAKARALVQAWRAKPPLPEANSVKVPDGGWDGVSDAIGEADRMALVKKIQTLLVENGYDPGPADGIEGPKTKEAVRAFQRSIGSAATGEIDTGLVTALADRST